MQEGCCSRSDLSGFRILKPSSYLSDFRSSTFRGSRTGHQNSPRFTRFRLLLRCYLDLLQSVMNFLILSTTSLDLGPLDLSPMDLPPLDLCTAIGAGKVLLIFPGLRLLLLRRFFRWLGSRVVTVLPGRSYQPSGTA